MQVLLQRDILGYRTVNTHTHRCLMLKRLNMDVTGIGIGRPLYQTVQQIDDRSIIIRIIDLDFLHYALSAGVGLFGCHFSGNFRVIVIDCLFQRILF